MINYLIHKRGRGLIIDDAEVNLATYLDRKSSAGGSSKLRDCKLVGSHVTDAAQVYGGEFYSSIIKGQTVVAGKPQASYSTIDCSEVSGTPRIFNCELLGITEVCDSPSLHGVVAQDAIIYGDCVVDALDSRLTVTGRIHEGTWTRAPKHIKLPWCELSECIDGKVLLNCYCRPVAFWLRHGPRIAHKWDWSEDMIAVTLATIEREFHVQNAHQVIQTTTTETAVTA